MDVEFVKANCLESDNYWEQPSMTLRTCIKINRNTNSVYIECYKSFEIPYYYHMFPAAIPRNNNDITVTMAQE